MKNHLQNVITDTVSSKGMVSGELKGINMSIWELVNDDFALLLKLLGDYAIEFML